jgi:UMF1 family MFS transporter
LEQFGEAKSKRKLIWSWALYDWANSAFATTVLAGFFPLFFKKYWSDGFSVIESTYMLGLVNSFASFALALMSPALGAIADDGAWRKRFLFFFTVVGAAGSLALSFVGHGEWMAACLWFTVGLIGFNGGLTFYDALLVEVAAEDRVDRVSALGYSLGYLGGGLLFAVNVWMYLKPETFGFQDGVAAIKFSFLTVGVWWLVFSLPLFMYVPERPARRRAHWLQMIRNGFVSVWENGKSLKRHKALLLFLLGFFFYNDAVNTIIKMAVDYGMSLGLEPSDLIKALLMVQFIGFPAAIAFGFLAEKIGPQRGIWFCLLVYLGVTVYAYYLNTSTEFFILAAIIGIIQGGIQALSRSFYARLVTPEESAQYFGFFNMMGKFSSILGPFLVGYVSMMTGNSRAGILILSVFFVAGGWLLFLSQRRRQGRFA